MPPVLCPVSCVIVPRRLCCVTAVTVPIACAVSRPSRSLSPVLCHSHHSPCRLSCVIAVTVPVACSFCPQRALCRTEWCIPVFTRFDFVENRSPHFLFVSYAKSTSNVVTAAGAVQRGHVTFPGLSHLSSQPMGPLLTPAPGYVSEPARFPGRPEEAISSHNRKHICHRACPVAPQTVQSHPPTPLPLLLLAAQRPAQGRAPHAGAAWVTGLRHGAWRCARPEQEHWPQGH